MAVTIRKTGWCLLSCVVAILGVLGTLSYAIFSPKVEERFTEFYILGLSGKATDYPKTLRASKEGKIIVGIINREHETVDYRLEVRIDKVKNNEIEPIVLEHNGKWEDIVGFTPDRVGDNQKVEFLLYRLGQSEVYQRLHLLADVIEE